jgi:hypothetical protein
LFAGVPKEIELVCGRMISMEWTKEFIAWADVDNMEQMNVPIFPRQPRVGSYYGFI